MAGDKRRQVLSTSTKWDQSSRNSVPGIYCNQVVVCFSQSIKQLAQQRNTNKEQGEQNSK